MQVEAELAGFKPDRDTFLTIGVFDGVHLGHQRLIAELLKQSRRNGCLAGVVTFRQHPEDLLAGGKKLPFLTDMETRLKLLKDEGIDFIVTLSFTRELADLGARQFLGLLQRHLRMKGLVIGTDFALGKGREGDIATLRRLGREMGFSVIVVPPLIINGEVVSSTALRQALADGDVKKVKEFTGRPFSLRGKVVPGTGRGRNIGFPTANLDINAGQALPPDGVYAGLAYIEGNIFQTMLNIGTNPTFNGQKRTVECFLCDYSGDLYGKEVQLDIIARLREEKKFASAEELKEQIALDVAQGKKLLETMGLS